MTREFSTACCLLALAAHASYADTLSVTRSQRRVTAAEVTNGAPAGSTVYQFFVTTDTDILTIGQVNVLVNAPLFSAPSGSDNEPPDPVAVVNNPALGADSWLTTPGPTTMTSPGITTPNNNWFDITNDGAVQSFLFAQLTTSGRGLFNGQINTVNSTGPGVTTTPFAFALGVPTGDVNFDGTINAADYVALRVMAYDDYGVWRQNFARPATGDFNFDGRVNAADYVALRKVAYNEYNVWRPKFGELADDANSAAVPEPSGFVLFVVSVCYVDRANMSAGARRFRRAK